MGIKIHEYLLERFTFGDDDYYDIDYFDGALYQTAKIKGSTIKAGILASITPENIYTQDGALQGQRTVDLNDYSLKFYTEFGETILIVANNGDSDKILQWKSENATRWELVVNNDISGSDIELKRYDGAGNYADSPFKVDRATGTITFNGNYSFPLTDGANGQVLTTDGAGNLTFEDIPTQATSWGSITGTLSSQTDLQTALNGKFDDPTGTSAQYIDGTGSLQTFPTFLDSGALVTEVYNNSGATLTKGTIVYINGGQGNLPTVAKAQADTDPTSAQTFGWVRSDITDMNNGYLIVAGKLSDLNTNGLGNGTQLYLSPTTAGTYTVTKPIAPEHLVYVGVVVRDHPTQGVIEVKIQNGYELDEIHDVNPNLSVTTPIDADSLLIQDSSVSIWKKLSWSNLKTTIKTYLDTFYQDKITLTTTGTSGASTLVGSTLNIPQYAGGLSYFTEAQSTTAPNATVNVDSLTAVASTTNADFAIRPKGTGAFTLAIPDNTVTGGNKRGTNAIDLQTARTNADQVASGNNSVAIGINNRAYNTGAVAIGGGAYSGGSGSVAFQGALANNTYSFAHGSRATASGYGAVSFGAYVYGDTIASGDNSFAVGNATASGMFSIAISEGNLASGQGSCALGGRNNLANAYLSYAFGGYCTVNGVEGRQVRGRALGTVQGETQKSEFYLSKRTTDATATTLTVAGGVASTTNQVILSNQSAYRFKGMIIGKQSGSTNACAWDIDGLIVRGATAGTTVLSVANVNLVSNTPAWGTPTLTADTTNGGLRVQVTGATATNIQWTAIVETTEVIYA